MAQIQNGRGHARPGWQRRALGTCLHGGTSNVFWISRFGFRISSRSGASPRGFTLVELILVMALLAATMALSAPSLSRFVHQRYVENEAVRFVAATEYARGEAVSRGVPFVVWVNHRAAAFGVEPAPGFPVSGHPERAYTLRKGIRLEVIDGARATEERETVATFGTDGSPAADGAAAVALTGSREEKRFVAKTRDGWRFVSLSPESYAALRTERQAAAAPTGVADAY